MTMCPLKQHIRAGLWDSYVARLAKKNIRYLTLYSPPIMDVKYFASRGYIQFEDGTYAGVTGITRDPLGYSDTAAGGRGRPELVKIGLAHKLLEEKDRELVAKFPFDVINLDYCNYLTTPGGEEAYVSGNLKDIISLLFHQRKANQEVFVMFLTTRTDQRASGGGFDKLFVDNLADRISRNIQYVPEFKEKYLSLFKSQDPISLLAKQYNAFIAVGIVKLVSMVLATHGYAIEDCDGRWLVRNNTVPERDLLHVAFLISRGESMRFRPSKRLTDLGTVICLERGAGVILDKLRDKKVGEISERQDYDRLLRIYGRDIKRLREDTFELPIPEPVQ
jgi:hypothetical protein